MKICQILLVPALLLAFIKQANASSGCDLDSNIADGCSGLTSCTLSNGYATGSCCNSSNLCDIDEGDCDAFLIVMVILFVDQITVHHHFLLPMIVA